MTWTKQWIGNILINSSVQSSFYAIDYAVNNTILAINTVSSIPFDLKVIPEDYFLSDAIYQHLLTS